MPKRVPGRSQSPARSKSSRSGAPKSFKADGTPKRRWSPEERANRGHNPRRSGGRPRTERAEQGGREGRGGWDDRRDTRGQDARRGGAGEDRRQHRGERGGGHPGNRSYDRRDQQGQRSQGSRDDRYSTDDRYSRNDRFSRDDRYSRDDRSSRGDRFSRDDRFSRNDRRSRDDRFSRGDRYSKDDRSRGDRYSRDDRSPRGDRFAKDQDDRATGRAPARRDDPRGRSFQRFDARAELDERGPGSRDRRDFSTGRDDRGAGRGRHDDQGAGRGRHEGRQHDSRPRGDRESWNRPERESFRSERRGGRHEDRGGRRDDRGPRRSGEFERRTDRRDSRPERVGHRRSFDDRPHREEDRWDSEADFEAADQMSWEAAELPAPVDDETEVEIEGPGFADLGLPTPLVQALAAQQITTPFPIQAATIPDALSGRDVLGRGRTGSGKTLGFGLPLLTRLSEADSDPKGAPGAVVLVPTRELALQVADVLAPLARKLGLSVILVAGGMAFGPQIKAFDRGVDVVVATPGRLIDLMDQAVADLSKVQVTVLDEADHMADLGFLPEVSRILDAIPQGQKLLFSATLDRGVDRLVRAYLHDPVTHEVDSSKASVTTMEHQVLHVLPHDKNATTAAIANREGRTVVFVRTQRGADRVAEQLREAGVMAGALHGGLTQGARARMLTAFKEGSVPVLVATDVAARGIHVDEVSLVLQVDPPMGPKDYLHRAGRTARAGGKGVVATIVLPHQRKQMRRITGQAGVRVEPVQTGPNDERLAELTGARTPGSEPVTEEQLQALSAPRHEPKSPRKRKPAWGREGRDRDDRRGPGGRGGRGGQGGHRSARYGSGGHGAAGHGSRGRDGQRGQGR